MPRDGLHHVAVPIEDEETASRSRVGHSVCGGQASDDDIAAAKCTERRGQAQHTLVGSIHAPVIAVSSGGACWAVPAETGGHDQIGRRV